MISNKAILYMILASACFTFINIIIRSVDHLPTAELVFFRSIGSVFCCIVILKSQKIPMLGTHRKLLLFRGLAGLLSMTLFYKAIQIMPLASAVSLRYLSPFFAAALAIIFLKEKMFKTQWLFFLSAFAGVLLLKGFDSRITLFALVIVLLSAFWSGVIYVLIRKIGSREHPVVIINYFLGISSVVAGIFSIFHWVTPQAHEWLPLISMGFFGFFAQYFMTIALQIEEANIITPFKYSEVIFTLLAGWVLFGEYQSITSIIAITIIIVSIIGNVFLKKKLTKKTA